VVISVQLISPPFSSDENPWPDQGLLGGTLMTHLTYRPGPDRHENENEQRMKFPGSSASAARHPSTGHAPKHPAELALERAQRRLDNLREVLGPAFGREQDGPRAA